MLSTCNNCPELAPISKTSPLSYDLSKAILRPVEQDLKREMSNSIFQKYENHISVEFKSKKHNYT
jgi:hypothetical protein